MTIFDSSIFSVRNAEIIFISVIGGALGNAMYSYATTEADWIGEKRAELLAVGLAVVTGAVLWSNKSKLKQVVS